MPSSLPPSSKGPDIPSAPGPETFALLEAREPLSASTAEKSRKETVYLAVERDPVGDPVLRAAALLLGFQPLGCFTYQRPEGARPVRDAYVDRRGVVRLSLRRANPTDRLEAALSLYYLSTTFDSGFEINTWSRTPAPVRPADRTEEHGGMGDLARDYLAHLADVKAYAARGHRALTIPDLATFIRAALWDWYRLRRRGVVRRIYDRASMRSLATWSRWSLRFVALALVVRVVLMVYRRVKG